MLNPRFEIGHSYSHAPANPYRWKFPSLDKSEQCVPTYRKSGGGFLHAQEKPTVIRPLYRKVHVRTPLSLIFHYTPLESFVSIYCNTDSYLAKKESVFVKAVKR